MKEQDRMPPDQPGCGQEKSTRAKPITSESVKNAHAAGDGAIERSTDSIPDEDRLKSEEQNHPQGPEQY